MNTRINISSGAKWEDIVGYSRAVKVGNITHDRSEGIDQPGIDGRDRSDGNYFNGIDNTTCKPPAGKFRASMVYN